MVKFFMKRKSGDSIIEVLIAVAIFSAIAVAALGIMNQGLGNAQSSLETTIVRTEMDTQAERIRFLADSVISDPGDSNDESSNSSKWNDITVNALETSGPDTDAYDAFIAQYKTAPLTSCNNVINPSYHAFALENNLTAKTGLDSNSSAIPSVDAGGLFVVSVKSPNVDAGGNPDYYDFYINTCWNAPGANIPTKLSTTIRIQNPKYTNSEPAPAVPPAPGADPAAPGELQIIYHWNAGSTGPSINSGYSERWLPGATKYNTSTATFTLSNLTSGGNQSLATIKSSAYSGFTSTVWYIDKNTSGTPLTELGYACNLSLDGTKYECKWDISVSGTIDLYAKWTPNSKPYLYCVNYKIANQGPNGENNTKLSVSGTTSNFSKDGKGFVEFKDKTKKYVYCEKSSSKAPKSLPVHMDGAELTDTNKNNFKFYGWRTDGTVWTGTYSDTGYYDAGKIIKTEGESGKTITVNTSQIDKDNNLGITKINLYDYEAVYYTTLYPHWRAIIDVNGDSFDACRNGGNNANCSIAAIANYQTEGLKFFSDKRKLLDAYTYSTTYGRVYYGNASIATNNNYIKIEYYNDVKTRADAINFGIIEIGTTAYDETHRLAKTDVSWFGLNVDSAASMTNFKPSPGSGKFYYSLFSSNHQSERKIKNSDVVYVSYRLADEENGGSFSISPSAESDSLCWHVFALDSDDKAIYFSNTVTGQSTATQCAGTFDLGLPF